MKPRRGAFVETIDARTLYEFLFPGQLHFYRWIEQQIADPMFREEQDWVRYIDVAHYSSPLGGGSNRVDYRFTVEMAKHVSQLSRQPRGYQFRRYFIDRDICFAAFKFRDFDTGATSAE